MPESVARPTVQRLRIDPTLASDVLAWVRANSGTGGPFYADGHAVEVALARLHHEQHAIRARCKQEKVPFNAEAFWSLYRPLIDESVPNIPRGARDKGDYRQSRRSSASVDVDLLQWADGACVPNGPFLNPSHLVETALRHLRTHHATPDVPFTGAPFDGQALWAAYRKAKA